MEKTNPISSTLSKSRADVLADEYAEKQKADAIYRKERLERVIKDVAEELYVAFEEQQINDPRQNKIRKVHRNCRVGENEKEYRKHVATKVQKILERRILDGGWNLEVIVETESPPSYSSQLPIYILYYRSALPQYNPLLETSSRIVNKVVDKFRSFVRSCGHGLELVCCCCRCPGH